MVNQNPGRINIQPSRESRLLTRLAGEQLRAMIHGGRLPNVSQLPSELELARAPNISRSTIRAVLSILENEGTIFRKRGVGTYVIDRLNLNDNLNINWGVTQVIKAAGAIPGISEMHLNVQFISRRLDECIKILLGTPIVIVERVLTAYQKPVSMPLPT